MDHRRAPQAGRRDVWLPDKLRLVVGQKGKIMTSRAVIKINFNTVFFFFKNDLRALNANEAPRNDKSPSSLFHF